MTLRVVAIDGPAGAGKSTVATRVADQLGYVLVNSGSLFRAYALACLERGVDTDDCIEVGVVVTQVTLELRREGGQAGVYVDGDKKAGELRAPKVSSGASRVAQHPSVRDAVVVLLREFAASQPVVMEGRDIGTVVFPDAFVKVFLTASVEERARRRVGQLAASGETVELRDIESAIRERDKRDTERVHAPLKQAVDAVAVDSSSLAMEDVVERIVSLATTRD